MQSEETKVRSLRLSAALISFLFPSSDFVFSLIFFCLNHQSGCSDSEGSEVRAEPPGKKFRTDRVTSDFYSEILLDHVMLDGKPKTIPQNQLISSISFHLLLDEVHGCPHRLRPPPPRVGGAGGPVTRRSCVAQTRKLFAVWTFYAEKGRNPFMKQWFWF